MDIYFAERPLPRRADQKVVENGATRHGLCEILHEMKHSAFWDSIRRSGSSGASPQPKKMPLEKKRRPSPTESAIRRTTPEPKKRPLEKKRRHSESAGSGGQGSGGQDSEEVPQPRRKRPLQPRGSVAADIGDPEKKDDDTPADPPPKKKVVLKPTPKWSSRL